MKCQKKKNSKNDHVGRRFHDTTLQHRFLFDRVRRNWESFVVSHKGDSKTHLGTKSVATVSSQ